MLQHVSLKEIEKCRKEMIRLAELHGLNSQYVIQCSQKLDNLLNQYRDEEDKQNAPK